MCRKNIKQYFTPTGLQYLYFPLLPGFYPYGVTISAFPFVIRISPLGVDVEKNIKNR